MKTLLLYILSPPWQPQSLLRPSKTPSKLTQTFARARDCGAALRTGKSLETDLINVVCHMANAPPSTI